MNSRRAIAFGGLFLALGSCVHPRATPVREIVTRSEPIPDLFTYDAVAPPNVATASTTSPNGMDAPTIIGFALNLRDLGDEERKAQALAALFGARLSSRFPDAASRIGRTSLGLRGSLALRAPASELLAAFLEELSRPLGEGEGSHVVPRVFPNDPCRPPSEAVLPVPSQADLETARSESTAPGRLAVALRAPPEQEAKARALVAGRPFFGPRPKTQAESGSRLSGDPKTALFRFEGAPAILRDAFFALSGGPLERRLNVEDVRTQARLDYAANRTCLSLRLSSPLSASLDLGTQLLHGWMARPESVRHDKELLSRVEDLAAIGLVGKIGTTPFKSEESSSHSGASQTSFATRSVAQKPNARPRETQLLVPCLRAWFDRSKEDALLVALSLAAARTAQAHGVSVSVLPSSALSENGFGLVVTGDPRGTPFGRALADIWVGTDLERRDVVRGEAIAAERERAWSPALRELAKLERGSRGGSLSVSEASALVECFGRSEFELRGDLDADAKRAFESWLPGSMPSSKLVCKAPQRAPVHGFAKFDAPQDTAFFAFETSADPAALRALVTLLAASGDVSKATDTPTAELDVRSIGEGPFARLLVEARSLDDVDKSIAQMRRLFQRMRSSAFTDEDLRKAMVRASISEEEGTVSRLRTALQSTLDEERALVLVGRKPETKKSDTPTGKPSTQGKKK